jgi:type IV secretory pathway VirB2 component (pilin)
MSALSLSDPPQSSVILPAVQWIQGIFLGNIATAIAVVAVASIGFTMLTGRVELRRGGTIILGCFILFGAATIANGLRNAAQSPETLPSQSAPAPPPIFAQPARNDAANPGYDPYAGASVPQQ